VQADVRQGPGQVRRGGVKRQIPEPDVAADGTISTISAAQRLPIGARFVLLDRQLAPVSLFSHTYAFAHVRWTILAVVLVFFPTIRAFAADPEFTIADGSASATVPFEMIDNHIVVEVSLNGKGPYRFAVDTGGIDCVTPDAARAAGLPTPKRSGRVFAQAVDSTVIGDLSIKHLTFVSMAFPELVKSEPIQNFGGLLGRGFFHGFSITVDYGLGTLTITDPTRFVPPVAGTAIPFTFNNDVPQIDGALDAQPAHFVIDTGSRSSLLTVAKGGSKRGDSMLPATGVRIIGWGVAGPVWGRVRRAESVAFGGFTISQPVVTELAARDGGKPFAFFGDAVNLGGEILKKFTVTFDYAHRISYWQPNADFGSAIPADESGLWLNPSANGTLSIEDVMPGSPAADAGLRVGDRVDTVDGRPAAQVDLPDLRSRLEADPPGTSVEFTITSGSAPARVYSIVLRDLAPAYDSQDSALQPVPVRGSK
jgi:hypothetical protein